MQAHTRLAVVGSGVIGLHTAAEAIRRGFSVTVYTDLAVERTTSWKAAASFKPFDIPHTPEVQRLVECSWVGYERWLIDHGPATGIRMHTHWEASRSELQMPWYSHIVKNAVYCKAPEVPGKYPHAWKYETFFIEMPIFLTWLHEYLNRIGVKFVHCHLQSLEEMVALPQDIIVNATGYGAKMLTDDPALVAEKGQTVILDLPLPMKWSISADGYYTYPRSNETLLGGTQERGVADEEVTFEAVRSIVEGNAPILPEIKSYRVKGTVAGIRPLRLSGPRIESQSLAGKVILHNYGHGGSGVTMAPGCAESLLNIDF